MDPVLMNLKTSLDFVFLHKFACGRASKEEFAVKFILKLKFQFANLSGSVDVESFFYFIF